MQHLNGKKTLKIAALGSLIVALIMVIGTYLMGESASRDTEIAVRNVSLLYLDELAGRREQVVASTLDGYINNMDIAVGLMDANDLSSVESLQAYQARMKQLYGLEKFAFVDEDGLIYTSRGTRTDIDQYAFDPFTLSKPEVSVKNPESDDAKLIIAVPTDRLPFEGRHLIVCFMEIDMDAMLNVVSLQSGNNSTTFCNLYTADGLSLTNRVLGGLASEDNLLTALSQAEFENGYRPEKLKEDFANGVSGVISFTYGGIKETMYYVPVHRTDWMLTYLIRESVISDQISTISSGIIRRGLIQSILTALVLAGVFGFMIVQMKKTADLTYEREISERTQQELEERIALQDELIKQEQLRAEQDRMITAMASDYRSVYYVDLDTGDSVCYRNDKDDNDISEGQHFRFLEAFGEYGEKYVDEQYRDQFLEFIKPENIRENLKNESLIVLRYLVRKDGQESYEMLRMAGVRHPEDRDDHIVHAVGVGFTDIDEQMRNAIAQRVALSDALKTAEEANRAKTAFLSNMSHEIRTPMNAIIGLDSLALNEPGLSDTTKGYLTKIGSSAQHLLSLINDILDMSRIESGRMVIRNEEFSFSKLMEQINIIFSGQCEEKGLTYDCRINGHLNDYYIGDSTKLRQVLINILGNAVKFTPAGGLVEFTVEKTAGFENHSTLRFMIRDNGIGMSKEYLPKLFEPFSQENSGATNKYGSSGLGMAITKNIIEMMNGKIEVESTQGEGTTFYVSVTLLDSDKKTSDSLKDIEIRPQDMRVLIIDDEEIAGEHAKLVLDQEGINSDLALSGKEAIEMVKVHHARQESYDLIIADWQMPEMDGVATTKEIRKIVGDESAIIILSAYNWDDILEEATAAGVDSFISKPLFSGSLLEEFYNALKKKNIAAAKEKAKADLTGRHILIAEDMEINAEILMEILKQRGIVPEHAENGKKAVEAFASRPEGYYDAILMDMRMPEMDGLTATTTIRAMDRKDAKTIPIIALTANAFDEDVQRSLQASLNAHLSKPIEPAALFETLENLISP